MDKLFLKPIEEAPENIWLELRESNGVSLSAYKWKKIGNDWSYKNVITGETYSSKLHERTTHFTLFPGPANYWGKYIHPGEFSFCGFENARKSDCEDHIAFCKALRDYLNYHYPEDNGGL